MVGGWGSPYNRSQFHFLPIAPKKSYSTSFNLNFLHNKMERKTYPARAPLNFLKFKGDNTEIGAPLKTAPLKTRAVNNLRRERDETVRPP